MAPVLKPDRPKIRLPLQRLDYGIEIIAGLGLLLLFGLAFLHYEQVLEQNPFQGAVVLPMRFGSKPALWALPMAGLGLYIFISLVNRQPERFDYLIHITPENAERQYTLVTRVIRLLKAFVILLFAFLVWRTIDFTPDKATQSDVWLLPLVMLATICVTFFYILKSTSEK